MGILQALTNSIADTAANQRQTTFYCPPISNNVLVVKDISRNQSSNIISNGSAAAVNDGQCMIITEKGKISVLCAKPGKYTYSISNEPSIYAGDLSQGITDSVNAFGNRFSHGSTADTEQCVYFFNTSEITGNVFSTNVPIPFRVIDNTLEIDMDASISLSGEYSFRITDPVLFYCNVSGNVLHNYYSVSITNVLRDELIMALTPALAKIAQLKIHYYEIPEHITELKDAINQYLAQRWNQHYGIELCSLSISNLTISDYDLEQLKRLQHTAILSDPKIAAALLTNPHADAMKLAAENASDNPRTLAALKLVAPSVLGKSTANEFHPAANGGISFDPASSKGISFDPASGTHKSAVQFNPTVNSQNAASIPESLVCTKCGQRIFINTKIPKYCGNCGGKIEI